METITKVRRPSRQYGGQKKWRYREIVEIGGAFYIRPVTGPWNRSVAPSDVAFFSDCQGGCLRKVEGDKSGSPPVATTIVGEVVHSEMAKPPKERLKNVTTLLMDVPKPQQARAVKDATKMIAVAARAESKEARTVVHFVTEPRPLVTFDQSTQTFWVVKPDKIKLMHAKFKGSQYQFLGVDDIKSGRARHRLAEALSFMMGKVIRDANAAKLLWGVDFDGPVKTRLIYLKNERGRRLSEPSSKVDTIGAQLSDKQKAWLWGIERYIKEMDEVWKRGLFRLQPGSHCNTCEFRNDCKVGQQFLADVAATTAGGAPDDQQPEDKGC